MIDLAYIESRCKKLDLKLPALTQLRAAQKKNDKESVERIAKNILSFLSERTSKPGNSK